jgi:hypothetical protein
VFFAFLITWMRKEMGYYIGSIAEKALFILPVP